MYKKSYKYLLYPLSVKISDFNSPCRLGAFKKNMFKFSLLLFVAVCSVSCNETTSCGQKEISTSYLDVAVDMISKAKFSMPSCANSDKNCTRRSVDCADIFQKGHNKSGVYTVWPMNRLTEDKALGVYCDMDTDGGGWTLIQRRGNFLRPNDYFYKDWKSYKEGFGDIAKDFWLGNDNIFALTNQKLYSVRFDLRDVELNKGYALYDTFWIDDEFNKYTLHISDYSGNVGDSMIAQHNNVKFSTKDQENDNQKDQHCAQLYKGGWWYNTCHHSNLNGLYLKGKHESFADGINWHSWKGYHESMESTEIKIRPKKFRPPPSDSIITPLR